MLPPTSVASAAKRKRATCCGSCDRKPCKHRVLACNLNGHGWFGWHRSRVWVVGEFLVVFFWKGKQDEIFWEVGWILIVKELWDGVYFRCFFLKWGITIELFAMRNGPLLAWVEGSQKGRGSGFQHGVTVRCRHVLFLKIKLLWF